MYFLKNRLKKHFYSRCINLKIKMYARILKFIKYATFFYFDNLPKTTKLLGIMTKFNTHFHIKYWYNIHDLYYRIGYLTLTCNINKLAV